MKFNQNTHMSMKEENGNCTIEYGFPNIDGDTEFEMKVVNNNLDKEYKSANKTNIEKKIRDEFDSIKISKYKSISEE